MELYILKADGDISFLFTSLPSEDCQYQIIKAIAQHQIQFLISTGYIGSECPGFQNENQIQNYAIRTIQHLYKYNFIVRLRNPSNSIAAQIIDAIASLCESEFNITYSPECGCIKNTYQLLTSLA